MWISQGFRLIVGFGQNCEGIHIPKAFSVNMNCTLDFFGSCSPDCSWNAYIDSLFIYKTICIYAMFFSPKKWVFIASDENFYREPPACRHCLALAIPHQVKTFSHRGVQRVTPKIILWAQSLPHQSWSKVPTVYSSFSSRAQLQETWCQPCHWFEYPLWLWVHHALRFIFIF